jgi:hypothetical protein
MAKSQTSQRDEKHELTRRALIKWSVAAGAALGVSRSKIFDILEGTAGQGVAYAAAAKTTCRSVALHAGNGGLAWFTQLWGFPSIAKANNSAFAWNYPGLAVDIAGTPNPLVKGPATPWADMAAQRQVTCFLSGQSETHTNNPITNGSLGGSSINALISAMQASSPSVIPVVSIGGARLGTAPGAAPDNNVANADGIVGLFNSAASRDGGLLATSGNAQTYKTAYDAYTQLVAASNRPTTRSGWLTGSAAAGFLGVNLATKLQIAPEDLTRYGINGNTRNSVASIGRALIVGAKAFGLGLTNALIMPAMLDDPHGAFDGGDVNVVPMQLKAILDAFRDDCVKAIDPDGTPVWDNLVFTCAGDTYKTPFSRPGWGDGTVDNSNVLYVNSSGHLKAGWYGDINVATGKAIGFGPDGKPVAVYNTATTAQLAMSSVAYAVAMRDERLANVAGISGIFGYPKA